jgi:hypothetical protein
MLQVIQIEMEWALLQDMTIIPSIGIKGNSRRHFGPTRLVSLNSKLEAFSTMIANVYDDAISWAFALKDKLHKLAQLDDGDSIVNDGGSIEFIIGGVTMDVPLTLTNLISFFDGMHLWYNDGNGTRVVTFIGADFVDDMQI